MPNLSSCAVAMIDALGVRGVWRGTDGRDDIRVLDTLHAACAAAYGMQAYVTKSLAPVFASRFGVEPTVTVLSLSDTVVIAALGHPQPEDEEAWGLVDLVCQCVTYVMRDAAQAARPLTYRGVVNFGRMLVYNTFLLGPAVDDAAEAYESADGAFVWLMPAADRLEPRTYSPDVWSTMAFKYDVPLKGGHTIRTTALSPYVDNIDPSERAKIRIGYETALSSLRVDVTIKRQNTLRFLDHVDREQHMAGVSPPQVLVNR